MGQLLIASELSDINSESFASFIVIYIVILIVIFIMAAFGRYNHIAYCVNIRMLTRQDKFFTQNGIFVVMLRISLHEYLMDVNAFFRLAVSTGLDSYLKL